jgi:hypothetical protein
MLTKITEETMIQDGMLGKLLGPIVHVSQLAREKYQNPEMKIGDAPTVCIIERSAILALCKFMCVSSKICKEHLDLIFDILASKIDYGVKANIIISVGDLFNRFPNILNERTKEIF